MIYHEDLYGEDGADTIHGHEGDDYISGGDHADTLNGNAGDDEMDGGHGSDIMDGGDGKDTMNGGTDADFMSGGDDDDTMDGGPGGDVMCGDGETTGDVIVAGDTDAEAIPDKIWAAVSDDTCDCGHTSTYWDGSCTDPTGRCGTNYLYDKPAMCP